MALRYKLDVVAALRDAGYTSYKIRQGGIINQTALQKLREGKMIAWEQFATVCKLLHAQPGELLEYTEDVTPTPGED